MCVKFVWDVLRFIKIHEVRNEFGRDFNVWNFWVNSVLWLNLLIHFLYIFILMGDIQIFVIWRLLHCQDLMEI